MLYFLCAMRVIFQDQVWSRLVQKYELSLHSYHLSMDKGCIHPRALQVIFVEKFFLPLFFSVFLFEFRNHHNEVINGYQQTVWAREYSLCIHTREEILKILFPNFKPTLCSKRQPFFYVNTCAFGQHASKLQEHYKEVPGSSNGGWMPPDPILFRWSSANPWSRKVNFHTPGWYPDIAMIYLKRLHKWQSFFSSSHFFHPAFTVFWRLYQNQNNANVPCLCSWIH